MRQQHAGTSQTPRATRARFAQKVFFVSKSQNSAQSNLFPVEIDRILLDRIDG